MVTRTKKYPIGVDTDMSFHDPLPRNHPLRTGDITGSVSSTVHATIEVKVKEGSPLATNLDDVDVDVMFLDDMEDMEDYKEFEGFIWDELAKGNTVEMKLIWPSDDELKKVVEQARKDLRWKLERAVAVRSDDVFKKRKKRKR